eukprot:3896213-Prymnesium_polylepis.2
MVRGGLQQGGDAGFGGTSTRRRSFEQARRAAQLVQGGEAAKSTRAGHELRGRASLREAGSDCGACNAEVDAPGASSVSAERVGVRPGTSSEGSSSDKVEKVSPDDVEAVEQTARTARSWFGFSSHRSASTEGTDTEKSVQIEGSSRFRFLKAQGRNSHAKDSHGGSTDRPPPPPSPPPPPPPPPSLCRFEMRRGGLSGVHEHRPVAAKLAHLERREHRSSVCAGEASCSWRRPGWKMAPSLGEESKRRSVQQRERGGGGSNEQGERGGGGSSEQGERGGGWSSEQDSPAQRDSKRHSSSEPVFI